MINRTVFKRIPHGTPMNDILSVLFHRMAATVYGIYSLWAVVAILTGIPSIVNAQGDFFQLVFSALVFVTATPACIGATFWPVLARLELFAGSGFLGLLGLYMYFLFRNIFEGTGTWAGFVLLFSVLVLPAARTVIVVILLLRQADEAKAEETREGR